MKLFGKLATLILSVSICFSAVACSDLTKDPTSGSNSNSGSNSGNNNQQQTPIGVTLTDAILGQLEEANTVTFSLDLRYLQQFSYKAEENKEHDSYDDEQISIDGTIAKTDEGYDAMFAFSRAEYSAPNDQNPETQTESLYVIDGISYQYDAEYGGYVYSPYDNSFANLPNLNAVADAFTTEEIAQFKALLGEALTEVYNVTEGNIEFAFDGKDDANALFDYLGAIDIETKTIESVINDVLALIDEELTVASIIAEIEKLDAVTVEEAVAAIDEFLTENADTTLQGLKDQIFSDERIISLLKEQAGMTDDDITEIQGIALADVIEPYKAMVLDEIVYNLVAPYILGEFDPEVNTYAQFLVELESAPAEIKDLGVDSFTTYLTKCILPELLKTTLAQMAGEDAASVAATLDTFNYTTMDALNADMSVQFDEYFKIDTLNADGCIEYTVDDEEATQIEKMSFAFSIDSISNEVTEIVLPEDINLVFAFWQNDVFLENNTGITLYTPDYDNEQGVFTNLIGYFYPSADSLDCIYFTYEAPTAPTNTWEITITQATIGDTTYIGEELETLLGGDLTYTLTFDYENTGDYVTDFVIPN